NRRVYLSRSRILAEVEDQQRIVLRVGTGQHVKHSRAERINVRARLNLTGEQLGRRVSHSADRSHTLFGRPHNPSDAEVYKHHPASFVVEHEVSGLEIAIDDRRLLRVYVVKHITNLNGPFADREFFDDAGAHSHLFSEVAAANPPHHKVVAAAFDEIVEDGWDRRMIELSKHFGLALEVVHRFGPLVFVSEHLDHLFHGTEAVGESLVARLIDRPHAAAADAADDRISVEQQRSRFKLLAWSLFFSFQCM